MSLFRQDAHPLRFLRRDNSGRIAGMKVLFVCTANKLRSPTAEDLFQGLAGVEVLSAGTDPEAPRPLTAELVADADLIFAMETHHRDRIRKKFKQRPRDSRIITLHIPDEYERGDPALIELLETRAGPTIRSLLVADIA